MWDIGVCPLRSNEEALKTLHKDRLDVAKVMEEFQKAEAALSGRSGTFKIDKPFEEALDAVLKAKPAAKKRTKNDEVEW